MTFLLPVMLLLVLPCAAFVLLAKCGLVERILRAAVYALIVVALARPAVDLHRRNGTLVVVADRSASVSRAELASQEKLIASAASRIGPGEKLGVVSFGASAEIEHLPQSAPFPGFADVVDADGSELNAAIDTALSLIDNGANGRIVVLSDGRRTGDDPLDGAAARAFARGIAIDHRLSDTSVRADTAVTQIDAPPQVTDGSALLATAWVVSPAEQTVAYVLRRGGRVIYKGERKIPAGLTPFTFRDTVKISGAASYDFEISPEPAFDGRPENNRARFLVTGGGGRPLLVIPASAQSRFPAALGSGGVPVVTAEPLEIDWTPAGLSGYSGVIVENRKADELGMPALSALKAWVETAGGGFALTGGRNSFGAGGYYKSPIEEALPVSMELRNEKRKFSVAVAIALDRSGSMAMPAGGGRTKMDLADIATADVIDMLSPGDQVSVYAVDSEAHEILPLTDVEAARGMRGKILSIESMGGGIYVYNALVAAIKSLEKSKASVRHVVLFADACDSEEPGDYATLVDTASRAGITISVIGLGKNTDCDAVLLEDIAGLGHGMVAFSEDPHEIPRLFAQDTITVARNAMVTNAVHPVFTTAVQEFSDTVLKGAPALGGYNMTYLQPGGVAVAVGDDENVAPLLAVRPYGAGRTLVFTGEADGEYSGSFAKWDGAGRFYSSVARYVSGPQEALSAGYLILTKPVDGGLEVTAYADTENFAAMAGDGLPLKVIRTKPGAGTSVDEMRLSWKSSDEMSAFIPVRGAETILPVAQLPDGGVKRLPAYRRPYSSEFRPDPDGEGEALLRKISGLTGGERVADLASAWNKMDRGNVRVELSPWFYLAAALLFLLEIIDRRTGWLSGAVTARKRAAEPDEPATAERPRKRRAKSLRVAEPSDGNGPSETPPEKAAGIAENESGVFAKAKQRASSRTGR